MNIKFIHISDLREDAVSVFSQYKENQLVHINEPDLGLFIAESPKVIFRALDAGYEPVSFLVEDKTKDSREASELWEKIRGMNFQENTITDTSSSSDHMPECTPIPVYVGTMELLSQITGFKLTRGVLCAMRRRPLPDMSLFKDFRRIAILENVVNPTNVGAIFRSAAALNIDAVLLTPGCSDPLYRRSARVSMGTVFQIPWTYISGGLGKEGTAVLRELGFKTAAMALEDRSVNIDHPELMAEPKLAIILGTEGEGLLDETIKSCDYVVKIPMSHGVDSLNVAAASAVVFWQLRKNSSS